MLMARKRKSSSPEPRLVPSKALKKDEPAFELKASHSTSLNPGKICTPAEGKRQGIVSDISSPLSPRRHSARFKCIASSFQSEVAGQAKYRDNSVHSSSPPRHPTPAEDDTELGLVITLDEKQCGGQRGGRKKGGKVKMGAVGGVAAAGISLGTSAEQEATDQEEPDINKQLDGELERKSRQHNLSSANVRNILHDVITNEHVVAMMKAAIRETQDMPMFEPKMTRSRLKEVVEKGVVIPTWNISSIKKSSEVKPPQFVDIQLEEEDSSDEEYCPDEEEEDETAEETFLESDVESTTSSPRGSRAGRSRTPVDGAEHEEHQSGSPRQESRQSRHLRVEVVPMGPPPPPQATGPPRPLRAPSECSFMEKLHAVDEELALSPVCMEPYQALSSGGGGDDSLVACRTRSKRPLRDVPLGRLEAELRAPDITPDMYECASAPEDRAWTQWLQGLMSSDMENEEEGDDDDDPEYNFLEDIDEPDLEDYRNDRAVRITKKEVNELMEELFETFQDELGVQERDEEGHEEEEEEEREDEALSQGAPKFNVPQAIRFEEPLANMLTERHRLAKEQLEALQQRRTLVESQAKASHCPPRPPVLLLPPPCVLILTPLQKLQLQQQIQQHVQLLTQVHMLCSPVEALKSEVATAHHFLEELNVFAERGEQARRPMEPGFVSIFRASNLQGALSLLQELKHSEVTVNLVKPLRMNSIRSYPLLPPRVAWLLATRPEFMYPELLPHCSLDPALHPPRSNKGYTRGEECLIVLGLKHFSETEFPYQLMCRYLMRTKKPQQLRARVHDMSTHRAPDNIIKFYSQHKIVHTMPLACGRVMPGEERPPVEREETILPIWLRKSLPYIHAAVLKYNGSDGQVIPDVTRSPPYIFPPGTRYPTSLPKDVTLRLHPGGFKAAHPHAGSKPLPLSIPALTKAPAGLTDATPFLAPAPGTTPNPGVILMAKTPSTPIHGAVSLGQGVLTPAHGAAPVNIAYTVSLNPAAQCLGQKTGHTVIQDVPSAPFQVSATVPQGAPCHTKKQRANQRPPRKLLPIQPAPPKLPSQPLPLLTISTDGAVNVLNLTGGAAVGAEEVGAGSCSVMPPTVIINLATPVSATVVCPSPAAEGLPRPSSESTPPSQDPVTHPNGALAQLRKLARPLQPAPPSAEPSQNYPVADGAVSLKLSPVFFSHAPSPIVTSTEHGTSMTPFHNITLADPLEMSRDTSPDTEIHPGSDPHKPRGACYVSGLQMVNTAEHHATYFNEVTHSIQNGELETQSEVPNQDQNAGPQNILVHEANEFLCVPQNHLKTNVTENLKIQNLASNQLGPPPLSATSKNLPGTLTKTDQQECKSVPFINTSSSRDVTHSGLSLQPSTSSETQQEADGLVEKTGGQDEGCEREEWGMEESSSIAGCLLALSESSSSPRSSLDSHADALERLMDVEDEEKALEESWCGVATSTPCLPSETEETGDEEDWDDKAKPGSGTAGGPASDCELGTQYEVVKDGGVGDGESNGSKACVNLPPSQMKLAGGSWVSVGVLSLSSANEAHEQSGDGEGGGGSQRDGGGGERQGGGGSSEKKEDNGNGGDGGGDGKGGAAGKKNGDGERGGKREGDGKGSGEKDGDGERERQGGEEEEEEDFDDLTQDEDEEEVMSSASEESVLSVPELQETMEKLTWLASERRLCGEGDSEEDNSPNSPNSPTSPASPVSQNSQEENSEEEEEGPPKGEELESGEGGTGKLPGGEVPQGADPPQASGKGAGRGRGRGRPPPRSLRRSRRQERDSKDASKLMLLYDDHILDNDPLRESKDIAFAQAYLNRVREALKDVPGKVEEFLGLLYEFDQSGEGRSAVELFSQLKPVLKEWPELLRDFSAFLLPEQALECGLFAEQQAFERSRRFLRQLEISFGENSSHYQKIVRALQGGPSLSPAGIEELKSQMASLLKGHTHLQGEFWVFFDELRPPPAQPGQFEEAVWPEEGGSVADGGDGGSVGTAGGAGGGFEEVTLPDLEEEEEVHKIPSMTARNRRRKELVTHGNEKDCDWPEKDCSCPSHDSAHESKLRRHKRKGCSRCHTSKSSDHSKVVKSRDPLYSGSVSSPQEIQVEKRGEEKEVKAEVQAAAGGIESSSPRPDQEVQSWDGPEAGPLQPTEEKDEEEDEEWKEGEGEGSPAPKKSRKDDGDDPPLLLSGEREREMSTGSLQPRPSTCCDPPVCAKNISLTPSGEKVILWTREADRVILTACQQQGANQNTFQAVSAQLGNKTANEVSRRFRDLMRLFHTAARQVSSEDEASNTEQQSATDEELD